MPNFSSASHFFIYPVLGLWFSFSQALYSAPSTSSSPPEVRKKGIGFSEITDVSEWRIHEKSMRSFKFPNELKVLLISDPQTKTSSALMNVEVGGAEDPIGKEGMAHYLEHVLFLGTKSYPKVGEFIDFISKNQGFSNAFTSLQETRFFFDISSQAFQEGLDRWADFFKEPLFDAKFLEKEKNAVNSEYKNTIDDDAWRTNRALQVSLNPSHPGSHFWIGTRETLERISRNDLIAFYKKYYSANRMQLILNGSLSLNELQDLATQHFSNIPNKNRKGLHYGTDSFGLKNKGRLVHFKPLKKTRTMRIDFEFPKRFSDYKTKTGLLVADLLSNASEGSLFDYLFRKGYATGVSAYYESLNKWSDTLTIQITLTSTGLKNWSDVGKGVFAYIDFLRETGLSDSHFNDLKRLNKINIDKGYQGGFEYTKFYGTFIARYPAQHIEEWTMLLLFKSDDLIRQMLSSITPQKAIVMLGDTDAKTDQVEPYFQVHYKSEELPQNILKAWTHPKVAGNFQVMKTNTWIPENFNLVSGSTNSVQNISNDPYSESHWLYTDSQFGLPKLHVFFRLINPKILESPRNFALASIYVLIFAYNRNKWSYFPERSGINLNEISLKMDGRVRMQISGFSDKFVDFTQSLANELKNTDVSDDLFTAVKQEILETYAYSKKNPLSMAQNGALLAISPAGIYEPETIFGESGELKKLTIQDYKSFVSNELFSHLGIEVASYGNITAPQSHHLVEAIYKSTGAKKLMRSQWPQLSNYIPLPKGQSVAHVNSSESLSNGFVSIIEFGPRNLENIETEAAISILSSLWGTDYFNALRTEKQVGYIVNLDNSVDEIFFANLGLRTRVQSQTLNAIEIEKINHQWFAQATMKINDLTDETFDLIKTTLVEKLEKPDNTMAEKFATFVDQAIYLNGDFDHKKQLIATTKNLTKSQFLQIVDEHLNPTKIQKISGYVNAAHIEPAQPPEKIVINPQNFDSEKRKLESY